MFRQIFALATTACAFLTIQSDCFPSELDQARPLASFRISKDGGVITLPVEIASKTYSFLLDSGATTHVFDSRLGSHLGKSVGNAEVRVGGQSVRVQRFEAPEAFVGKLPIGSSKDVILTDLSEVRNALGEDIRGVLGIDFFVGRVIQIDLHAGKLTAFDRSAALPSQGTQVRLRQHHSGQMSVDAIVGSQSPISMIVDTGFTKTLAFESYIFRYAVSHGEIEHFGNTYTATLSGIKEVKHGCLNSFRLESINLSHLMARQSTSNKVGLSYLSRFVVTLDVTGRSMWLDPKPRFDRSELVDASGLHLLQIDGKVTARFLDDGSPAAVAGLVQGDVIESVNGTPSQSMSLHRIRRELCGETRDSIVLGVSRDGQTFNVRFEFTPQECRATVK